MWTGLKNLALSLYTRAQIQKEEGQTLVEYTLIIALVSLAVVAALGILSGDIGKALEGVGSKLAADV